MSSRSPFPPIADYAFLSDTEVTALIAPSGNVEWLCLPRMDSPSVFGSILDRDAGGFRFGPADVRVPAARRYLPGTMVVETSWATPGGWAIVRDVLLMGPWHHGESRSASHTRAPTDYDAEHILLRTVRCVNGEVQLSLACEPGFDYGRATGEWQFTDDDYHQVACRADGGDIALTLTSDMNLGCEGPSAVARTLIKEGETRFCALSWGRIEPPRSSDEAHARLEWTAHHWQHWLARGRFPDHPWRAHLERSALTLRGLTFAPTGAIIAAATTSLPETPGGERNWDYRYSWIRDSTFGLWSLFRLGLNWEAADFLEFVADAARGQDELRVMYTVGGEQVPDERTLDHLAGYEGARPVRVGNGATAQRQHDVWGSLLDSIYLHARSRDHLEEQLWPLVIEQVEAAIAHWQEPDQGIWEARSEPRHYTSSKVMCWVAADRGVKLARMRGDAERAARWQAVAAEIHADVCAHGVNSRGAFRQHYDTEALDASLLLVPLVRFLPANDERVRQTVLAVAEELSVGGLIVRYRADQTEDGLPGIEGAFMICSFWLVSALVEIGEVDRAGRLCEKLLTLASPLGLYAEEVDPDTGRHLGNFPQALTHLACINALMHLIEAEHDGHAPERASTSG
ncbi:MAG: glycoside hydrolase family 15 protein [Chloroflexi bacterium]|nr:glycoside hydrolase family 15 protein [Chloroflexota bacterium]